MKQPLLCFMLFLGFWHSQLSAQSAVYFCSETGYYGYCYGTANVQNCAYQKCLDYGGKYPQLVGSIVYNKGYGAIAIGSNYNGKKVIGVAAGMENQDEADRLAIRYCQQYGGSSPYIDAQFYDAPNTYGADCCCQYETYDHDIRTGAQTFREYCYAWISPTQCRQKPGGTVVSEPRELCKCTVPR